MGTAKAWLGTLRLRTLPAAAAPVLVGCAIAWDLGAFALLPALAALLGALLLQVGTNLANDYYDHVKGADTPARTGPTRASASGALRPTAVRNAAYLVFGAAAVVGLYLVLRAGWPILAIGVAGIISGILYTAGPRALAYVGLGEPFVFLFFGPLAVAGTVYVQALKWHAGAWAWGVPLGLLAAAILVVNNLRDVPTDADAGKRTIAVRMGQARTRWLYALLVGGALGAPLVIGHWRQDLWLLLPLAAAPLAWAPGRLVWQAPQLQGAQRAELNRALAATAQLLLAYALLAAAGIVGGTR